MKTDMRRFGNPANVNKSTPYSLSPHWSLTTDHAKQDEEQQAQPKKLSLNVIKESSEASDAESDEEPMAPPPTALASMRRHSFHQFPAPPTKSQSKVSIASARERDGGGRRTRRQFGAGDKNY
ncbi:hypothetical protein E2C01_013936 [Portunus trituberculatus]|uniref:Uncharacterized protein n=1 Tax=Portunus trituberculatus TaxID=210409 RepID=A0A5B7DHW7_PORTR|nr:hypothetical protein [Portunus trituberculatus]